MTISPAEAEQSLAAIEDARHDSRIRRSYRRSSPFVIGWGLTCATGYVGSTFLSAEAANALWLVLIVLMTGFSAITVRRQSNGRASWRWIALGTLLPTLALVSVVTLASALFDLPSPIDIMALYCFMIALAYAIASLTQGRRYAALALALAGLTALGLWLVPPSRQLDIFYLDATLLVAGGLWFRRA